MISHFTRFFVGQRSDVPYVAAACESSGFFHLYADSFEVSGTIDKTLI
uniref:Uncharacterized protein n=1 Tax=Podoviridae sp. ctz6O13 TaxID=2827757 RepID=A0A8S5TL73_9CAUD|nr:MAG TPA: hypothetical protein [Podoviridae sp. ctz6O13]